MQSLAHLPGPILDLVFSTKDTSHLVVALWKCGNRMMVGKLPKFISIVVLKDNVLNSTLRWPKCSTLLRNLQHLDVTHSGYSMGHFSNL